MKSTKIVGLIFCVILMVTGIGEYNRSQNGDSLFLVIILGIISIILLYKLIKSPKENKSNVSTKFTNPKITLPHLTGLSIPENTNTTITSLDNKYELSANGITFNLNKDKITDISLKTDTEIQKQSVSSIGGAVGGAVLFGPLGAMIGGRAKTKNIRTITHCLIFTYLKDENINFIAFDASYNLPDAKKIIKDYQEHKNLYNTEIKNVEL